MRVYFLGPDNLQKFKDIFKNLYNIVISKFTERLESYSNKKCVILITELNDTLINLKDSEFEKFFIALGISTLEKIRFNSVSNHTDECVIRAIFDILLKYCIDFEFKITHLCCNNEEFKLLQLEILRDLRYKIIYSEPEPDPDPEDPECSSSS